MRTAPTGKYFLRVTRLETGKQFSPFYNGYNTKKEANKVLESFDVIDGSKSNNPIYKYELVDKNGNVV
jgi:hypothetical protein